MSAHASDPTTTTTGNCNVCDDVFKQTSIDHDQVDKNKPMKKVNLDFKQMISIHKKPSKGEKVDPQVVSNLLLGGVINIIS